MKIEHITTIPRWGKTKEQIWAENFAELEEEFPKIIPLYRRKLFMYAAAAVVAIVFILPSVAFLYTENITAQRGEHVSVVLPDGSNITLNAESELSYKPYWWYVKRNVDIRGEAYFEVAKGETFTATSPNGRVAVLGTCFNIFDRTEGYRVTCLSGKVSVESKDQSAMLISGMSVNLTDSRLLLKSKSEEDIGWIGGNFTFLSVPLKDVIAEVERQYNIKVRAPIGVDYIYTGNFSKDNSPEQVLEIIGKPFGIELSIEK